jgi:hypothetical protein
VCNSAVAASATSITRRGICMKPETKRRATNHPLVGHLVRLRSLVLERVGTLGLLVAASS